MKKLQPAASPSEYVSALRGWQAKSVARLRSAVRASASLEEKIKWGNLVYISNGPGPVLVIRTEAERVLFGFWRGQRLRTIEPRLKAGGKYEMATLELHEGAANSLPVLRHLTRKAVALNKSVGDPTKVVKTVRPKRRSRRAPCVRPS